MFRITTGKSDLRASDPASLLRKLGLVGRPSGRQDLRSGNVSADVIRVMRRERWRAWWARQMKVRKVNVPDAVRRMSGPAVYFALVVWLFPLSDAYEQFDGVFEKAKYSFEWSEPEVLETASEDLALRRRARRVVHAVLTEIGHGIAVESVEITDTGGVAFYRIRTNQIVFSNREEWDDDTLLDVAAHEATHALWHRIYRGGHGNPRFATLINEMTAFILGAHVAGRVRSREGADGDAFREKLVATYRQDCDDTNPSSIRNLAVTEWSPIRGDLTGWYHYAHYGSVQMVDEIDAICSRYDDSAWDAARAIRDRYLPPPPPPPSPREWKPTPTPSASSQVEW